MPIENHHVFFAADPGLSLREAIEQLRSWLEKNDIRPLAFKHAVSPSGAIELQLTFKSRHEASLFEQQILSDGAAVAA
jgi:hypothetical protein